MQTVTFEVRALRSALSMVRPLIQKRTAIPVLQCVRIDARKGGGLLTATDLDIDVQVPFPAILPPKFAGVFSFAPLFSLLSLQSGDVQAAIEIMPDGRAFLRWPGARYAIPSLPASDFPDAILKDPKGSVAQLELPEDFRATLANVARFVSTEETRYYLNGVSLVFLQDRLNLVATDGHRLTWAPLGELRAPIMGSDRKTWQPIIPLACVRALLASRGFDPQFLVLYDDRPACRFECAGGVIVTAKLIDGSYPDVARVIPAAHIEDKVAEFPAAPLKAALRRMLALSVANGNRYTPIQFRIFSDRAYLLPEAAEMAGTAEKVPVAGPDKEFMIGFSARYVLDILEANAGAPSLRLVMKDPASPVFIPGQSANFVLMPLRTGGDKDAIIGAMQAIEALIDDGQVAA